MSEKPDIAESIADVALVLDSIKGLSEDYHFRFLEMGTAELPPDVLPMMQGATGAFDGIAKLAEWSNRQLDDLEPLIRKLARETEHGADQEATRGDPRRQEGAGAE